MRKIGFIGIGNMGSVLASVAGKSVPEAEIFVSSKSGEKAEAFALHNDCTATDNRQIAEECEMIFLGVKPHQMKALLEELSPILAERTDSFVLVSMAAGLSCKELEAFVGFPCPMIRIMPNTPSFVGKGCIPYTLGSFATEEDAGELENVLQAADLVFPLEDRLMDAASSLSGCGPAFAYIFMEALADAGVACGLPRDIALALSAQTVAGAAEMVLQTGEHPAALKDKVCSPGGSTIAGVCALEEHGLRNAAQKAVLAAFARNLQLGK
ncbi:MAG: pyrroline-5-carboxylate reductase [Oscillospiraceae bacterium]|nr:pyrroline-5-carboxylate reductase [Oscillospiraceae bacterium]